MANRSALRYHGGKWRIAKWIYTKFPQHVCYVEPFGGAASVLLQKPPSTIEVYNDLNSDVVNFFQVLRSSPADLITAIDLTPYSREEFTIAQMPANTPLEKARRFYVWSWQGRGRAGVAKPGGWRFMSKNTRSKTPAQDWNNSCHLWAFVLRLKQVHIENDHAFNIIDRYDTPDSLFYLDPPYVQNSRGKYWAKSAYKFECDDNFHIELCAKLQNISGMAILSGYPNHIYDKYLPGWHLIQRITAKDNGSKKAIECLWLSPNAHPTPER